ncbi:hypothetical protein CRENBAI_013754 [Crenichthys baileyi]|uniref:Uncharacterized protein n=1 Tax=Crenichthys baileyi TaxID=28760 RepID=A0AAV9QUB7_9TELE
MNLLKPKDLPGSTGSDCRNTPRLTCPACPPSNLIHQLEEPAHTAPANLSLRGLLASPQHQLIHHKVSLAHSSSSFKTIYISLILLRNRAALGVVWRNISLLKLFVLIGCRTWCSSDLI